MSEERYQVTVYLPDARITHTVNGVTGTVAKCGAWIHASDMGRYTDEILELEVNESVTFAERTGGTIEVKRLV